MARPVRIAFAFAGLLALGLTACQPASPPAAPAALIGAWQAKVQFSSGSFAPVKDLTFLYAYNSGGTMTESSNYDCSPAPSPPAYGEWRATGTGTFETKYTFYTTQPPADAKPGTGAGVWMPAGHGVLTESIQMSADGRSYESTVQLALFDSAGQPVAGGGEATAHGTRIGF